MTAAYLAVYLETTGLDANKDQILEIAWAPLDAQFNQLSATKRFVIEMTPAARERLTANEYTKSMHQGNGLIKDSLAGGLPLSVAEKAIQADMHSRAWAEPKLTIFGSSVHFDLRFTQAHMPALAGWLHYRVLDVTTLISFARAAGAWVDDREVVAHRAADDINWSISAAQRVFAALKREEAMA